MNSTATAPVRRRTSPSALTDTFDGLREELVSSLFYLLGNYEDAQDAAQEAFIKCWRRRKALGQIRNLKAWIFRVGLNAAKDLQRNAWRRRLRPLTLAPDEEENPPEPPTDHVVHDEEMDRLRRALLDLRPEEKEVFLLRQNAGLTYDEVAARTHRPVGTVKTQMRSAVHKLREVFRDG